MRQVMSDWQPYLGLAVISVYVFYSVRVQVRLLSKSSIPGNRKMFQSVLIWLVPFAGAGLVNWNLNWSSSGQKKGKGGNRYRINAEESDYVDNF